MSDEPHQFLTSGELDVNDLFSTKLQEGACTAHLRGVFTNTGEVEITLLKKNEELASPAFQAELNTLLGALRGDSGPLRDKGIGIALKMEDGASSIVPYAILSVLTQLGVITPEEACSLPRYHDKNLYNNHHAVVGRTELAFQLEQLC